MRICFLLHDNNGKWQENILSCHETNPTIQKSINQSINQSINEVKYDIFLTFLEIHNFIL